MPEEHTTAVVQRYLRTRACGTCSKRSSKRDARRKKRAEPAPRPCPKFVSGYEDCGPFRPKLERCSQTQRLLGIRAPRRRCSQALTCRKFPVTRCKRSWDMAVWESCSLKSRLTSAH